MIRSAVAKIIANIIALYVAIAVLSGFSITGGIFTVLVASVVLMLANVFIKPILKLLSLPFVLLTMGFFMVIINAVILWFTEKSILYLALQPQLTFLEGMTLNFAAWTDYLLAGIILSLVDYVTHWLFKIK